ncbi:MAG TPA: B12-binding domain-containing protein [Pyrinomonadaceae bacterium]
MSMTFTEFMTTRQLARLWKVSEATIKRWADAGHLRPSRTLGGHRRFSLEEVARFQSERGLTQTAATKTALGRVGGAAAPAWPTGGPVGEVTEAFYESLAAGREATATAVLLEAYLAGASVAELLDEVVAGALRRVGDEWEAGRATVADEHLATRTATRAVETLRGAVKREGAARGLAVCCAAEEELHELAVLCAQTLLESEGWEVRNLGGNTPFFALCDAVERHRPRLVCVSSTTRGALAGAARDYAQCLAAARAGGARVVLGGAGFRGEGVREKFPADLHAESLSALLEFTRD